MTNEERLRHIAVLAHFGGAEWVSAEEALRGIRMLTLHESNQAGGPKWTLRTLIDACVAARDAAAIATSQPAELTTKIHRQTLMEIESLAAVDPGVTLTADEMQEARDRTERLLRAPLLHVGDVFVGEEGTFKGWTVVKWRAGLRPIAQGTKLYAEISTAPAGGEGFA